MNRAEELAAAAKRNREQRALAVTNLRPVVAEVTAKRETVRALKKGTAEVVDEMMTLVKTIGSNNFFPTSQLVAQQMIKLARIPFRAKILEPHAGTGRIADEVRALKLNIDLYVNELNADLCAILTRKGYTPYHTDFLDFRMDGFTTILMNPPFHNLSEIDHAYKAWDLLDRAGNCVSIMSASPFIQSTGKAKEFRRWLDLRGYAEPLPAGSFMPYTNASTYIVYFEKI